MSYSREDPGSSQEERDKDEANVMIVNIDLCSVQSGKIQIRDGGNQFVGPRRNEISYQHQRQDEQRAVTESCQGDVGLVEAPVQQIGQVDRHQVQKNKLQLPTQNKPSMDITYKRKPEFNQLQKDQGQVKTHLVPQLKRSKTNIPIQYKEKLEFIRHQNQEGEQVEQQIDMFYNHSPYVQLNQVAELGNYQLQKKATQQPSNKQVLSDKVVLFDDNVSSDVQSPQTSDYTLNDPSHSIILNLDKDTNKWKKIVIIGDRGVGKSSLFVRYLFSHSNDLRLDPTNSKDGVKFVKNNDGQIIEIIDFFSSKEMYSDSVQQDISFLGRDADQKIQKHELIRNTQEANDADILILVFQINRYESFNFCKSMLDHFNQTDDLKIICVANKCDNNEQVTDQQILDFIQRKNIKLFQVSAHLNLNLHKLFNEFDESIYVKPTDLPMMIGNQNKSSTNLMNQTVEQKEREYALCSLNLAQAGTQVMWTFLEGCTCIRGMHADVQINRIWHMKYVEEIIEKIQEYRITLEESMHQYINLRNTSLFLFEKNNQTSSEKKEIEYNFALQKKQELDQLLVKANQQKTKLKVIRIICVILFIFSLYEVYKQGNQVHQLNKKKHQPFPTDLLARKSEIEFLTAHKREVDEVLQQAQNIYANLQQNRIEINDIQRRMAKTLESQQIEVVLKLLDELIQFKSKLLEQPLFEMSQFLEKINSIRKREKSLDNSNKDVIITNIQQLIEKYFYLIDTMTLESQAMDQSISIFISIQEDSDNSSIDYQDNVSKIIHKIIYEKQAQFQLQLTISDVIVLIKQFQYSTSKDLNQIKTAEHRQHSQQEMLRSQLKCLKSFTMYPEERMGKNKGFQKLKKKFVGDPCLEHNFVFTPGYRNYLEDHQNYTHDFVDDLQRGGTIELEKTSMLVHARSSEYHDLQIKSMKLTDDLEKIQASKVNFEHTLKGQESANDDKIQNADNDWRAIYTNYVHDYCINTLLASQHRQQIQQINSSLVYSTFGLALWLLCLLLLLFVGYFWQYKQKQKFFGNNWRLNSQYEDEPKHFSSKTKRSKTVRQTVRHYKSNYLIGD